MGEESNQVKWIGIRPVSEQAIFQHEPGPWAAVRGGITRTQICKNATVNGAFGTIHTVTAGKTFYLTSAAVFGNAPANQVIQIDVADAAAAQQYQLLAGYSSGAGSGMLTNCFPMPIVIPAGYLIRVNCGGGPAIGCIQGWEE